jgi:hypothetical protein
MLKSARRTPKRLKPKTQLKFTTTTLDKILRLLRKENIKREGKSQRAQFHL